IKSRTSSPLTPLVVARKLMASRSQQSSAKATRTRSPLSQPISKPSEHQRRLGASPAGRPSLPRSTPPAWGSSRKPGAFLPPSAPLVIGRLQAPGQRLALEDGVDTPVAVGWQLGDDRLDLCHEFVVWQRRPANPFLRSLSRAFDQIGAGDSNHLRHGLH